jgi:hypothetical protein
MRTDSQSAANGALRVLRPTAWLEAVLDQGIFEEEDVQLNPIRWGLSAALAIDSKWLKPKR